MLSFFLSLIVGIATNIYNEMPVNLDTVAMPLLYGTIIGTLTTTIIPAVSYTHLTLPTNSRG